ncbi:MAG: prolyl oligopeptidase family serine peptidase [Balneolales bacterium]|nr:prolyl oligopeptidase family serine peptidase [Balneolales bacterium]
MFRNLIFAVALLLPLSSCAASTGTAQQQDKVPLTIEDFNQWQSISNQWLSPDGSLLIYGLNPQEGDGGIMLRPLSGSNPQEEFIERGTRFSTNYTGTHLAYFNAPLFSEQRQALIDGKRFSDVFTDTLYIRDLRSAATLDFPKVKQLKMPEESGAWTAFLYDRELTEMQKEKENEAEENAIDKEVEQDENGGQDVVQISFDYVYQSGRDTVLSKNDLELRSLTDNRVYLFPHADQFYFSEDGGVLLLKQSHSDSTDCRILHIELDSFDTTILAENLSACRSFALSASGDAVAFIGKPYTEDESNGDNGDEESEKEEDKGPEYFTLYLWTAENASAMASPIADQSAYWVPEGWMINEFASPRFSENGERLLFGIAPEPPARDPEVEKIDMAAVDIWHWQDDRLQSQQLVQLNQDRRRTFLTMFERSSGNFMRLEHEQLESVTIPANGNAAFGIGLQNRHYLHLTQWKGFPAYGDYYIINLENGETEQFLEKAKITVNHSPDGRFMAWYDYKDQNWYTIEHATGQVTSLTSHIDTVFFNELHDAPSDPNPYGVEGWTENDAHIIIRDRYDLWIFDPTDASGGKMLTNGFGRAEGITLRSFSEDADSDYFSSGTVYLTGIKDSDKSSGVYTANFGRAGTQNPALLWSDDVQLFTPSKAKNSDRWMLRKSTFHDFPDIYITDSRFRNHTRVTEANPQQANYLWGDVELFHFTSINGDSLEGLLYVPEDFDPTQTYPMIVYFYERTSGRLHFYRPPAPSASTITPAFYTSRGYIVAMPDIVYREGNPGRSAEDAVIGMTLHLLDKGFVDRNRIGLQGQSWGGYQIAHIITRSNMFAAAMAGAPVSNMVSAYGGIRWASGLNRQFQYEQTQSRIGGTLWERPLYYIENSPIFFADRVRTPLLMMHNDDDGAVPWYQGIEFFTALKRLDQPVWMLNYNNEAHNLRERVNRKDLSRRMQQFFDHYLMDAPMPVWMKYGVPATLKGYTQGFELVE